MEPLSKETIMLLRDELYACFGGGIHPHWERLFFTARLGAEFVKQTSHKEQP